MTIGTPRLKLIFRSRSDLDFSSINFFGWGAGGGEKGVLMIMIVWQHTIIIKW